MIMSFEKHNKIYENLGGEVVGPGAVEGLLIINSLNMNNYRKSLTQLFPAASDNVKPCLTILK